VSHSFVVGKTYRNRTGEYVVQAIEGDRMVIRYVNGGILETTVQIQIRIWENIQAEEQMAREEERQRLAQEARAASRQRAPASRGARYRRQVAPGFGGFQESDFEPKQRGIAWSGRQVLGKRLAWEMSQRTGDKFGNWNIPRQPEVHIAQEGKYSLDSYDWQPTFFVAVDQAGVTFGFRLGKREGASEPTEPWFALAKALGHEEGVRQGLRSAMETFAMSLDLHAMEISYGPIGRVQVQERAFLWQRETAGQISTRRMEWEDLASYLQEVAPGKRGEILVRRQLPPAVVLEAGSSIVDDMVSAFEMLMPLYATAADAGSRS
jgi:hypothetical protein